MFFCPGVFDINFNFLDCFENIFILFKLFSLKKLEVLLLLLLKFFLFELNMLKYFVCVINLFFKFSFLFLEGKSILDKNKFFELNLTFVLDWVLLKL